MPDRFEKRLERGPPVVTDGGMGVLVSSAVAGLRCPEEANIRAPASVLSLHTSFINPGAELIETNTFAPTRHQLRSQFPENQLPAINGTALKLAREARQSARPSASSASPAAASSTRTRRQSISPNSRRRPAPWVPA